jgi:hypothetical protein
MRTIGFRFVSLAAITLGAIAIDGQDLAPSAAAPVPTAILNAKRVFVSNAGSDSGLFPHPFGGDPDRGYNQFYAALKSVHRWELSDSPSNADLVLELRLTAPYGPSNADKQKGASDPVPMFRLAVFDAKSHFLLWAMTEGIEPANLQKTHDHNFDAALNALLGDFEALTGRSSAAK